jgi:hypothetical protein
MRLTQTARVLLVAVLLLAVTAVLWWGAGFRLGAALLDDAPAWRRSFGYGSLALARLFALALVVPVTLAVISAAAPQFRWVAMTAIALGAVLISGERASGDVLAVVFFTFGIAAVSEYSGTAQLVAALAVALVVAFASLLDVPLGSGHKALATLVRAVFFYVPLLVGPTYVERYALKRLAR